MQNIKLIIEFDGTDYNGWQSQQNGRTVQDEIERAIMVLTREKARLHSSGRTDAGVHAYRMIASFMVEKELDLDKFKKSLNAILPDDICVQEAEFVDAGFHPRKSASKKIYQYHILNRTERSPFTKKYAWHIREPLDIESMIEASKRLIGEHDFVAFASTGSEVKTTVRTIYDITIAKEGDKIMITCTGSGFLKYMVRNIVGLLAQVGKGTCDVDFVNRVLEEKQIEKPYVTAPARGLFLVDVLYE